MARPKNEHPTPAELEILKVLWEHGPGTVRQVMQRLDDNPPRAYTTLMTLMNLMCDKGLLQRQPEGRAFVFEPIVDREQTLGHMLGDMVHRAFEGSASTLVAHLLAEADPSDTELQQIRNAINAYKRNKN